MLDTPDSGTAVRKTLSYNDPVWADRLTSVKVGNTEKTISYEDAENDYISGNPEEYFTGKDYRFQWQKGRQLSSAEVGSILSGNRMQVDYTYDMSGIRSFLSVL